MAIKEEVEVRELGSNRRGPWDVPADGPMAERVGLAFVGASRVETAAGTSFKPPQELEPALLNFTTSTISTPFFSFVRRVLLPVV